MPFQFVTHQPSQPVATCVESIWYAHGQVPYRRERILPNGRPVLIVNLGAPFHTSMGSEGLCERLNRDAWVVGTQTQFLTNQPLQETHVVGVTFRPWGAGPLLGIPGHEITNRTEAADCVWGNDILDLRERLAAEPGPLRKIAAMEGALRSRLSVHDDPGFASVVFAARRLEMPKPPSVGDLSTALGISRKHLNTVFKRHVGLSPKAFSRICRFNRALETLAAGTLSLDELALAHGYYDQAHFNRDISAFGGISPTVYRARRDEFLTEGDDLSGLFVPEGGR